MANVRIKDLTTTAATTASDDFFGVDGTTNGTRKLNAYSPTFGGNLTVSGTGTSSVAGRLQTGVGVANSAFQLLNSTSGSGASDGLALELTGANAYFVNYENGPMYWFGGAGGANQLMSLSATGNLTVSGTGTNTFTGDVYVTRTTGNPAFRLTNGSGGSFPIFQFVDQRVGGNNWNIEDGRVAGQLGFYSSNGGGTVAAITDTGNVLIGTTTDSANGKLQLATHTTSAGGIGFGTGMSLFSSNTTVLRALGTGADAQFQVQKDSTLGFAILVDAASAYLTSSGSNGSMFLRTAGGTTALTLASDQKATFAATVTATGYYANATLGARVAGSACIGGTANAGGQYSGSGAVNDVSLVNKNGDNVMVIPTGTTNATFAGAIAIGNTVQTAAAVASTHKVTISIGGSTYYLLATNV